MEHYLQAIATIFSLVNPGVCLVIFTDLEKGKSRSAASRDATVAMALVALVLIAAALAGARILNVFGISLDAFSVAGGAVLIAIGFSMLMATQSNSEADRDHAGKASGTNLGKLILFAASPGTITGVMTLAASHSQVDFPLTALVAIAVVVPVTWLVLLISVMAGRSTDKPGLGREMANRYMGLIIVAMGIQFALTGYKAFMAT